MADYGRQLAARLWLVMQMYGRVVLEACSTQQLLMQLVNLAVVGWQAGARVAVAGAA